MRHTIALLSAALLLAGASVGCSKSYEDSVKDCATALTERTGGDASDTPSISDAKKRVDALDDTLAGMVRQGYSDVADEAFSAVEEKTSEGGKSRPEACKPLSKDDYTALHTAKVIDGLGWTDEGGEFDKLKMVDSLGS